MADDGRDFRARLNSYRTFQDTLRQGGLAGEMADAERAHRRRRSLILACATVAMVLLAGSCFGVRLAFLPERQARAVALAYLEGLAEPGAWLTVLDLVAPEVIAELPSRPESDGEAAPAMSGQMFRTSTGSGRCRPPTSPHTSHSQGFTSQTTGCYSPPIAVRATDLSVDSRQSVVSVTFEVEGDDRRYPGSVRLRPGDGAVATLLARWLVVDGFGTLDIRGVAAGLSRTCMVPEGTLVSCVTLNGLPVAVVAGTQSLLTVLPGRHQLEVHLFDPFHGWRSTVYTVVVPPGGTVDLEPAPLDS